MNKPQEKDSPSTNPADRLLTKAEFFFQTGQDSLVGINGELYTAAYGRWIRMQ